MLFPEIFEEPDFMLNDFYVFVVLFFTFFPGAPIFLLPSYDWIGSV